ncbi:hypothetical protein AgCh_028449 [Apium graveolens]
MLGKDFEAKISRKGAGGVQVNLSHGMADLANGDNIDQDGVQRIKLRKPTQLQQELKKIKSFSRSTARPHPHWSSAQPRQFVRESARPR